MEKWRGNLKHTVWVLDDNARPHKHASIMKWTEENKIERWLQPPYSPDLIPCNFSCFHALKRAIGAVHYVNLDFLQNAIDNEIMIDNANGTYPALAPVCD